MSANGITKKLERIQSKREWLDRRSALYVTSAQVDEVARKWFKSVDAPIQFSYETRMFAVQLPKEEHAYISYAEKNTNFALPPRENALSVQPSTSVSLHVAGEKEGDLDIKLSVILYNGGQKVQTDTVNWNERTSIDIPESVDDIRLALRVKGTGSFHIHAIHIDDRNIWTMSVREETDRFKPAGDTNWYVPKKSSITYLQDSSFRVNTEEKQFVYVPYAEANIEFASAPQRPIAVDRDRLSVTFTGEKDANVDVKLSIILYKQGERQSVHQVILNDNSLIQTEGADAMRLAIRMAGKGKVKLSAIAVSGVGYWLTEEVYTDDAAVPSYTTYIPLTNESLFGLGQHNHVLYHPAQDVFESKLIGQQFMYLEALEQIGIHEAPKNSILQPKENHYYEFYAGGYAAGDVKLTLFVVSYRNERQNQMYQVPFHQKTVIQFTEDTTDVKVFVRVHQSGYFHSLHVGINERLVEITNSLAADLKPGSWFKSGNLISFESKDDMLVIRSNVPSDQKPYISYREMNNNFNIPPETPLMSISPEYMYEFTIAADKEEGMEVIPMVIGYADEKKLQVLQLKMNDQTPIRFHPDVRQIRLAIRISGEGICTLKEFKIDEKEIVQGESSNTWVNKREMDLLQLSPVKPLQKLKMAAIFDVFTTASYKEECELITFTPDNWLEVLESNMPDLLMVESAWEGNGGSWNKRVGYFGEEAMKPLFALLQWCKLHNIPTVFWNKEDPVHFDRFIPTAKHFDYIFTTDENVVPNYQQIAGHERVYALPFAAQPVIHNPIKIVEERENKACFAGSYYIHHEDRAKDMDRLLDYAAKYGLEIFDRNYEKNKKGLMPNHRFPERFHPYIKGSLKYYEIDKAYKGYTVMINVNTVKYSPTMFSRRIFEGLACGTPIVSTYAQGIENMFGDLVYISEEEEQIDNAFRTLLHDEEEYRRKSLLGIREVLSKHTYAHRLQYIIEQVGLRAAYRMPKVTVIAFAHSKEQFFHAIEQFERQEYEQKELYILTDTFDGYVELFQTYNTAHIKTFVRSYMHNYQNMLQWIDTPYVAFLANDDYYGSYYLTDLMLSTTYTDSDIIGKHNYYRADAAQGMVEHNSGAEYEFVQAMRPTQCIIKRDVFAKESLGDVLVQMEQGMDLAPYMKYGKQLYSCDKYNYLRNAYKVNKMQLISQVER